MNPLEYLFYQRKSSFRSNWVSIFLERLLLNLSLVLPEYVTLMTVSPPTDAGPGKEPEQLPRQKTTAVMMMMMEATYGGIPAILMKNLSDCPLLLSVSLVSSYPETKTGLLFLCFLCSFLDHRLMSLLQILINMAIN